VPSQLPSPNSDCEYFSSFIVRRNPKSAAMCCWTVLRRQRRFSAWYVMSQRHLFVCRRRQLLCNVSAVPSRQLLPH
jgi:hypothetical protein